MSWFQVNKIVASILIAICIFLIIGYIGNKLINPKILEEQAYLIEIPEDSKTNNSSSTQK